MKPCAVIINFSPSFYLQKKIGGGLYKFLKILHTQQGGGGETTNKERKKWRDENE